MLVAPSNPRRKITKAFKVTPEESKRIELLAAAAGVSQKQYILTKLEDEDFVILPDIRTYKMLRNEMRSVYQELCRLRDCSEMDDLLIYRIELLSKFFIGIAGEEYKSEMDEEDETIADMERG